MEFIFRKQERAEHKLNTHPQIAKNMNFPPACTSIIFKHCP